MDATKISVKLFVKQDEFGPSEFVPVFHRWIQEHSLEDHLLIDVADYAHVPAGPGTLLVTLEANIHMDREADRLGLMYFRKTPLPGTFGDRLRAVLASTLKVAAKLEQEPGLVGRLKFRTDELLIRVHDRLLAPNTPATFESVKGDFDSLAVDLYGAGKAKIAPTGTPSQMIGVTISASSSVSVSDLLAKVSPVAV